jgi:gliding motility-associated-like protein
MPLMLLAFERPHTAPAGPQGELRFSENKGQWNEQALFRSDIPFGSVYLEKNNFFFVMYSPADLKKKQHPSPVTGPVIIHGQVMHEEFVGANPNPVVGGAKAFKDYENYYHGNDPHHWASGVKVYPEVNYSELYNGIDLKVYTRGSMQLKYDFTVKPGADASNIQIHYKWAQNVRLKDGALQIKTSVGSMIEEQPYAYQEINGERVKVKCDFVLTKEQVGFNFPEGYNHNNALVIDPNIVFSTYTGATADNWGYTATYDNQQCMYTAGLVRSGPDPFDPSVVGTYGTTAGAFQSVWGGGNDTTGIQWSCDMGVSKFSADGSTLLFRTFIGGSNNDTPNSMVADAQDNLIIYGVTYSTDFPVTANAYQNTNHGISNLVVVKLNPGATALLGSTYIGGSSQDGINFDPTEQTPGNLKRNYGDQNRGEVNIDASNNIYVAACTMSPDFPVTTGAAQTTFGGTQDGCVFKLNSDCSQLIWSTYLGGNNDDACYSLDLSPIGTVFVAGGTMSTNFPTTNGVLNTTYQGGNYDGFVTQINANGTQFLSSTYIGTSGDDQVYAVKLDEEGNVYFVGQTNGAYPLVSATYSNPNSGQFVAKMKPTLDSVFYSTVFGSGSGKPNISPTAFLVDTCENVYIAGWGDAATSVFAEEFSPVYANDMYNMPLTPDAFQSTTDGTDFYFIVLSKDIQSLLFASYFGGDGYIDHVDGGTSRFDKRGVMYEAICAGCGGNSLTPTTPGAWSQTNDSWNCNELGLKIAFNLTGANVSVQAHPRATGCVPLTVQFQSTTSNVLSVQWNFMDGSTSTQANPTHTFTDTGTYNVMLVGYNPNSCNGHDTAYISVRVRNDSLSADFLPNTVVNCDSDQVDFVSHNFNTTMYSWNFGDGTMANTDSVNHQYAGPGNYLVTLIVSDTTKCNLLDTFTTPIHIPGFVSAVFTTNDGRGCIPLVAQLTSQPDGNATYYWSFGDGGTDTSRLNTVTHTYLAGDTFQVRLIVIDSTSCNIVDTTYGTEIGIDSFGNAGFHFKRTFFMCDSVQITAWTDYTGEASELWTFGDGTQIANVDSVNHTYTTAGTFVITHYIVDPRMICKPLDTSQIAVSLVPLDISASIPDTVRCLPLTADFVGHTVLLSTNFYWFFGDGDSTEGTPVAHTYQNTGTYHVILIAIDTNACVQGDSAFGTVTVINDSVHANFELNVLHDCDSLLQVNLVNTSRGAVQFSWTLGDGTNSATQDENHSYTAPGTYTITLIASDTSSCYPVDTISKKVTLLPNVTGDFTVNETCYGHAIQFTNLSNPALQFAWNFGDSGTSNQFSPAHVYGSPGGYIAQLIIIDSSTCNVADTVAHPVQVAYDPVANFSVVSDTVNYETPIGFTNSSTYYNQLQWNFGDSTGSEEANPVHTYEKIGWIKVCLTATNAFCSDSICRDIYVAFKPLIGVPNAFSPNGDGINDIVFVEGKGIVQLVFRIYNRWGEKVFESHDQTFGWDGYYKGVLQEVDAYGYTVEATFINGETVNLKGNITLLR